MKLFRCVAMSALMAALFSLQGCAGGPAMMVGKDGDKGFLMRKLTRGDHVRNYGLFIPLSYDPKNKYPVIIFLHGLGESAGGQGDGKNLTVGLAPTVALQKETFPFICIFPQCNGDWSVDPYPDDVITALDDVAANYSIDNDRVSLTGISIGGYGTYIIAAKYPNRFSALVPMATNGVAMNIAQRLRHIPVRAYCSATGDPFGGANDRAMVARIQTLGGTAEFIETPTNGHNCWDFVYGSGEALSWLLQQRRIPVLGNLP